VQEFVLFILGDVLCLLQKFSLRLQVGGTDNESAAKGKSS
jgi:hypothetical protein